jgi:hypothetical protein
MDSRPDPCSVVHIYMHGGTIYAAPVVYIYICNDWCLLLVVVRVQCRSQRSTRRQQDAHRPGGRASWRTTTTVP